MPKKILKRLSPNPEAIKGNKYLGFLGDHLHSPQLWHFNRRNIPLAFAIGCFCMWIPFPMQTVIAAISAVILGANLPLSVALVFITNPITIPPMFYAAYKLGAVVMGQALIETNSEGSWEWITTLMSQAWQPFLLGCLLLAIASSLIGYFGIQLLWRFHVVQRWKERKQRKCRFTKD